MTYNEAELNKMNGPELVAIYNELAPTQITKFKSKRVGVRRVLSVQEAVAADPVEAKAVVEDKPEVEGPNRSDVKARQAWVREEATEEAHALNRKEKAIFHGDNEHGLVAHFVAAGGDPKDEDAAFLIRYGTIAKWPSVADTNKAIENLRVKTNYLDAE